MEDIKSAARRAKRRLKTGYWAKCKQSADITARKAQEKGLNEGKVKSGIYQKVRSDIRGEKPDEFYLKVKELLDTYGEVSDAIGRLTDRQYFDSLAYEERVRYTLELSEKYLKALERYRREKETEV